MKSPAVNFREKMMEDRRKYFDSLKHDMTASKIKRKRTKKEKRAKFDSIIRTRSQVTLSPDPKPKDVKVQPKYKENIFGALKGIPVGSIFATRLQCSRAGVHRPPVAGIHGCNDGCYSVVLSGNYEDNEDEGNTFTYTGAGGRDLKGTPSKVKNLRTAPQSKNQELVRGNLSLYRSIENKTPVRVIRGYKGRPNFSPSSGYRYDGLYTVLSFTFKKGKAGHVVYKFKMERCAGQDTPPWETKTLNIPNMDKDGVQVIPEQNEVKFKKEKEGAKGGKSCEVKFKKEKEGAKGGKSYEVKFKKEKEGAKRGKSYEVKFKKEKKGAKGGKSYEVKFKKEKKGAKGGKSYEVKFKKEKKGGKSYEVKFKKEKKGGKSYEVKFKKERTKKRY